MSAVTPLTSSKHLIKTVLATTHVNSLNTLIVFAKVAWWQSEEYIKRGIEFARVSVHH